MALPPIHQIRESLSSIEGALTDQPWTSSVDVGDIPHVVSTISQPEQNKPSSELLDTPYGEFPDEESPIIFEIPPQLDEREIQARLGERGGRDFERLIQLHGIDALGWYFPFHHRIAQHGIYISSAGVLWLVSQCFRRKYSDDPREDISRKFRYATHAILRHETFHFAAECMAANWELAIGAACYVKAQSILRSSAGYIEHEEALANGYMLRGFRWESAATRGSLAAGALADFTRRMPPGYNEGSRYIAANNYTEGCRDLAAEYQTCISRRWYAPRHTFESLGLYPNVSRIDWHRCPIIIVDEHQLFEKLAIVPHFIFSIPVIRETSSFAKQLMQLGSRYDQLWTTTKRKLSHSTTLKGLDFKTWPPRGADWYSVRVDRDVRARLRNDKRIGSWFAEEIGRHGAMGH
jgi:hypothetical protein